MSAHCSLSPDDVFVCCVGSMCVGLGPAVSADWLPSCAPAACVCLWQWSTQSLVRVPKWSEAELALPRSSPVSAV